MSRRFRLTREGRVFVVVTLLVGVAAINTGNNLLYLVLSLLLGLLLLSGVLSDLSLHRLGVTLSLPRRLEAGREAHAEVSVRNRKRWLSSFSIVVSPLDGEAPLGDALFLKIEPGERATALVAITPARRGELAVGAVEVRTQYPFALVDKRRRVRVVERALVHPRTTVAGTPGSARDEREEVAQRSVVGRGEEVIGLRELHPLEVADDLHFARSAALGRWVRREHGESRGPASILILDERRDADPEFEARFERRIEEVASLARSLHRRGEGVGLVTSAHRVDRIDRDRSLVPLLDVLAKLEALPPQAPPPRLPRGEASAEPAG
jgi:uncharacterized protein (DUF58 family)